MEVSGSFERLGVNNKGEVRLPREDLTALFDPVLAPHVVEEAFVDWQNDLPLPKSSETPSSLTCGPVRGRLLPGVVAELLESKGLDWYGTSIELDEGSVDPFYRKLAQRLPEGQLILGGGSDLVQLVMGLPKQFDGNADSVNTVMPLGIIHETPAESFIEFADIEAPAFGARQSSRLVQVTINGESTLNLQTMIQNTLEGRDLAESVNECMMVPIKHGYLAVVPAEGPVILYFRTASDFQAYLGRLLTLPEAEYLDTDAWLKRIPPEERFACVMNTLQYCAIVYERGCDSGWCFDPFSHAFLRDLAGRLSLGQAQEVQNFVKEVFQKSGLVPRHLPETFEYLGLARPHIPEELFGSGEA